MESRKVILKGDMAAEKVATFLKAGCKHLRLEIDDKWIDVVGETLKQLALDRQIVIEFSDPDLAKILGFTFVGAVAGVVLAFVSGQWVLIPLCAAMGAFVGIPPLKIRLEKTSSILSIVTA